MRIRMRMVGVDMWIVVMVELGWARLSEVR